MNGVVELNNASTDYYNNMVTKLVTNWQSLLGFAPKIPIIAYFNFIIYQIYAQICQMSQYIRIAHTKSSVCITQTHTHSNRLYTITLSVCLLFISFKRNKNAKPNEWKAAGKIAVNLWVWFERKLFCVRSLHISEFLITFCVCRACLVWLLLLL